MKLSNMDQEVSRTCDTRQNSAEGASCVSTISFRKSGARSPTRIALKDLLASARHTKDVQKYLHPCSAGDVTYINASGGSDATEDNEHVPPLE